MQKSLENKKIELELNKNVIEKILTSFELSNLNKNVDGPLGPSHPVVTFDKQKSTENYQSWHFLRMVKDIFHQDDSQKTIMEEFTVRAAGLNQIENQNEGYIDMLEQSRKAQTSPHLSPITVKAVLLLEDFRQSGYEFRNLQAQKWLQHRMKADKLTA